MVSHVDTSSIKTLKTIKILQKYSKLTWWIHDPGRSWCSSSNPPWQLLTLSSPPVSPNTKTISHLREILKRKYTIFKSTLTIVSNQWCVYKINEKESYNWGRRDGYMHEKTHGREITYCCEKTSMSFREDSQVWKV